MAKFGKDKPSRGEEGFIEKALTGGHGPSNGIEETHVDRPEQSIKTAFPMDNVRLAMHVPGSMQHGGGHFAGDCENLEHSLRGASAVQEEVGAVGHLKHVIIPNH